jgi:hypothetical protein
MRDLIDACRSSTVACKEYYVDSDIQYLKKKLSPWVYAHFQSLWDFCHLSETARFHAMVRVYALGGCFQKLVEKVENARRGAGIL